MRRSLHLTSPHMRGKDVRDAQWLLRTHGYDVAVDGDFGLATATACAQRKRDLGYPSSQCVPTFGQILYGYLKKDPKPLPRSYRLRAAARRRKARLLAGSVQGRVESVLGLALSQIGTKESPFGSNRVKYSLWYGIVGSWCAMFVSWCCAHARRKVNFRYAFCPFVVADARGGRNGLSIHFGPARSTSELVVALYDWPGESRGEADHIGISVPEPFLVRHHNVLLRSTIRSFGSLGPGDFWSVEGNTSLGNQSNGGAVMLRKRNRRNVQAFVKVRV